MSTYFPQPGRIENNMVGQSEKLRLPETEFFYKQAMARSAEIRTQVQEAKANNQGLDKAKKG